MQYFSSDGLSIAYRDDGGDGDPVLLIHGFASNMNVNWQSTGWMAALGNAGYRVIAMDVRGHGRSDKPHDPASYRLALMAGDAAALIGHLGLSRPHVMGYSMGARIAAALALHEPERPGRLVFGGMGSRMFEGIGGEDEIIAALLAPSLAEVADETGRAYRRFADQTGGDLKALAACMASQREAIAPDDLRQIERPTLVAVGTEDAVAGSAERLADVLPQGRAFAIPGRDHMLATGDRAFKAAVLAFLAEPG